MKWEYKVVLAPPSKDALENELKKPGNQGWELVAAYVLDKNPPGRVQLIFKRPKP
jgi:hypothetical protein